MFVWRQIKSIFKAGNPGVPCYNYAFFYLGYAWLCGLLYQIQRNLPTHYTQAHVGKTFLRATCS